MRPERRSLIYDQPPTFRNIAHFLRPTICATVTRTVAGNEVYLFGSGCLLRKNLPLIVREIRGKEAGKFADDTRASFSRIEQSSNHCFSRDSQSIKLHKVISVGHIISSRLLTIKGCTVRMTNFCLLLHYLFNAEPLIKTKTPLLRDDDGSTSVRSSVSAAARRAAPRRPDSHRVKLAS